jgi:hypothetical protein
LTGQTCIAMSFCCHLDFPVKKLLCRTIGFLSRGRVSTSAAHDPGYCGHD